MNYTIRSYSKDDYGFVWDLHLKENQSYIERHTSLSPEKAKELFDRNIAQQTGFIVEQNGQRIGCYFLQETQDHVKLSRFFLVEALRGKGLGNLLLEKIMKDVTKPIYITVWEDNPVMDFWRKKGFSPLSTDENNLTTLVYKGNK